MILYMFYMNIANCLLLVLNVGVVHQVGGGRCQDWMLLGRFWSKWQPNYLPQMTYPFPFCWRLFSNYWENSHWCGGCVFCSIFGGRNSSQFAVGGRHW